MKGATKREQLLEELLVECLDWIRQTDIYDDQRDPSTQWVVGAEIRAQPPLPGDCYVSVGALRGAIDDTYALVSRIEALLPEDRVMAARARGRTRRRLVERKTQEG